MVVIFQRWTHENQESVPFATTQTNWLETWNDAINSTNYTNAFCSIETSIACNETTIEECTTCSQAGLWIFFAFSLLLALTILSGNCLVLIYVYFSNRTNRGIVRASLAFAEILTSVLLVVVTLPNIVWTLRATPQEIYSKEYRSKNSLHSTIGGMFYMFCTSSFLFLLAFLSYTHFAIVKWPLHAKFQSKSILCLQLVAVWLLALIPATYPSWFPNHFDFSYVYYCFLYLPSVKSEALAAQGYIFISLLLPPYLLTTSFIVGTAILIRRNEKNRRQLTSLSYSKSIRDDARSAYILLAWMEAAFTLTFVPTIFAYTYSILVDSHTVGVLISNYLTMCNGMMNLFIYWWRDRGFKRYTKSLINKWKHKLCPNAIKEVKRNQSVKTVMQQTRL